MKLKITKSVKSLLFIFMMSLAFISCDKDDDDNGGGNNPSAEYLTASIDGTSFTATELTIAGTLSGQIWLVQGGTATGNTIRLTLQNYTGPGTYTFGGLTNSNSGVYIADVLTNPLGWTSFVTADNSGSVTIETDDGTTTKGTYAFEAIGGTPLTTKIITNGTFQAIYD